MLQPRRGRICPGLEGSGINSSTSGKVTFNIGPTASQQASQLPCFFLPPRYNRRSGGRLSERTPRAEEAPRAPRKGRQRGSLGQEGGTRRHNCVMVPWPEGKTACLERKELYCLKFLCIKYRTNKLRWGSSIGLCGILSCPSACLLVSHRAYTHKSET